MHRPARSHPHTLVRYIATAGTTPTTRAPAASGSLVAPSNSPIEALDELGGQRLRVLVRRLLG